MAAFTKGYGNIYDIHGAGVNSLLFNPTEAAYHETGKGKKMI